MKTYITFVIPVRHPENCKDWGRLKANLSETMASISAQTNNNWRAFIVANHGAELPELSKGFEIVRVNFPPNVMHEQNDASKEDFLDAVRLDKGKRILAGMLCNRDTNFYMVVDDDDFISNQLVEFVSKNLSRNGWKISEGYVWGDAGKLLFIHDDFANFCGTSLIIRSDLYKLPKHFELATSDYIKTMLGSHVKISKILEGQHTPLAILPFRGAVYRIGHAQSHSRSPRLLKKFFFNKCLISQPQKFLQNLLKLRITNKKFKHEFFGKPLVCK